MRILQRTLQFALNTALLFAPLTTGGQAGEATDHSFRSKENRTCDQVLGDLAQGNGDPSLCVFGERVTPNQHKMVREFVLLDNTYCSGILSADGHQWADSAFATDYMEKSFAGFPRSYPDGMEDDDVDALAYAPTGFIWDNALAHGRTVRDYGEFAITRILWHALKGPREPYPTWAVSFTGDAD
jgi:hypothetical protein